MAKQQTNQFYNPRDKKKGRATKSTSKIKSSKRYVKPYKGQGR